MFRISQREYNVLKPSFNFESEPNQNDFFITKDESDSLCWSTNGKTISKDLKNLKEAVESISKYSKENRVNGNIWFIDGSIRRYITKTEDI